MTTVGRSRIGNKLTGRKGSLQRKAIGHFEITAHAIFITAQCDAGQTSTSIAAVSARREVCCGMLHNIHQNARNAKRV